MRYIVILLLTILPHFIYSQDDYPRKAIIDGDTLVLITPSQLTKINVKLVDLKECTERLNQLAETNRLQSEMIDNLNESVVLKDKQIDMLNSKIENYEETLKEYNKEAAKRKRFYTTIAGVGVSIGIVSLITLIVK